MDERRVTDVRRFPGEVVPGVRLAMWTEEGEAGFGVLAQDVQRIHPNIVTEGADGFLRVNFLKLAQYAGWVVPV
jgi:hypothetical protein